MVANVLTEGALRARAGATSFVRGEDYVRYVHGLRVVESGASASIQARNVYLVDLQWSTSLTGHCTCPHHASGNFCKHLVALGLAVLDSTGRRKQVPVTPPASVIDPLEEMDAAALIRDLADVAPEVARLVELKGAGMLHDEPETSQRLVELVDDSLRVRGHIDYRRSFDVAADVQRVLDELDDLLGAGRSRAVQPPLLRALTRLRTITQRADDSSGVLGDACQRAADLYARAASLGHPAPVELARWLVNFRATSPGWPQVELADFVSAFDDKALKAYRAGVARLEKKYAGSTGWERLELDRMRLELADHDGDVDLAVAILVGGEHAQYDAVVARLRTAGRGEEASQWLDKAVAAGRVARGTPPNGNNDYWLDPADVADDLLARGREDDALVVWRDQVRRATDIRPYTALLDFAERLGRRDEEERLAKAILRQQAAEPYGSGALLVQVALAEGDPAAAWAVAAELGAGHAWETLANASATDFPGRAAGLHRERVDQALTVADSARYPEIAASLLQIGALMESAGEAREFASYVDGIRHRYRRRPSLMAALDRRGL